ncbi:MAG TPA: polyhydroxyalkanoic acid system family protein [Noviherbaspirillum sp.]
MADISIRQAHRLSHSKAKAAAQKVADQMAKEYDMASEWKGDVLRFKRSGVSGSLKITETDATLEISLGILLKAFAPTIEQKVTAKMKKVFAAKA